MKPNITSQQYLEHLNHISKDLVDAYFADETHDKIDDISDKYNLSDNQTQSLREDASWALIGLIHPDMLKDLLTKDLGVSQNVAAAIVGDLNHELFLPHKQSLTETLLTYPPKKEWFELQESRSMPAVQTQPLKQSSLPPINLQIPQTQQRPSSISPPQTRPIAPPPLQVVKPLGTRPAILEVQKGVGEIRRAAPQVESRNIPPQTLNTAPKPTSGDVAKPQAPNTKPQVPNPIPQTLNPTSSQPVNSSPREPVNSEPTSRNNGPATIFKYTHPAPPPIHTEPRIQTLESRNIPPVSQISNDKSQEPNLKNQTLNPTSSQPVNSSPREPVNSQSASKDTFHQTPQEHNAMLPTESHNVMDLEEYHKTGSAGPTQQGNMLNLKQ